jgi:hypothetical protein
MMQQRNSMFAPWLYGSLPSPPAAALPLQSDLHARTDALSCAFLNPRTEANPPPARAHSGLSCVWLQLPQLAHMHHLQQQQQQTAPAPATTHPLAPTGPYSALA